ncbi:MAG: glutathione transferase GstA, partial [Opitutae bacterium]|nr:glutathione transferase GstA [Opitutae bacterium]
MKLFFSKGACSLAPHIILRELGLDFELVTVDTPEQKYGLKATGEFQKINPGGKIPALVLDNGEIITECSAILIYLADLNPDLNLFPKEGTFERYRGLEWLNQIATEWHKQFVFLFWPTISTEMQQSLLNTAKEKLTKLNNEMKGRDYIYGDSFSIIDAYMFVCLDWLNWVDPKDTL